MKKKMVLGGVESPARLVRRTRSYVLLANKSGTVPVRDPIVDRFEGEDVKKKRTNGSVSEIRRDEGK